MHSRKICRCVDLYATGGITPPIDMPNPSPIWENFVFEDNVEPANFVNNFRRTICKSSPSLEQTTQILSRIKSEKDKAENNGIMEVYNSFLKSMRFSKSHGMLHLFSHSRIFNCFFPGKLLIKDK